jgi:uncharacterized protein with PQ loop repeat
MAHQDHGLHHFHKRKRANTKEFTKAKKFFDKAVYLVSVVGILMTLPQIYNIWILKEATGVSILSWGAYVVLAIFWLIYALLHRSGVLIFNYISWIVLDLLIVVGALIYG